MNCALLAPWSQDERDAVFAHSRYKQYKGMRKAFMSTSHARAVMERPLARDSEVDLGQDVNFQVKWGFVVPQSRRGELP